MYFITGEISQDALPDFYGPGALPVNYPNEWDLRRGNTGYGIWLHGVPSDTFARPPRASDGCMALSNQDMLALLRFPGMNGTPVILSDRIHWVSRRDLAQRRERTAAMLASWRADWESLDVDRYLANYATNFQSGEFDRSSWGERKRKLAASKKWVKVTLGRISMFRSPGREELVEVTFEQQYESDSYRDEGRKRQYWIKENGTWRIAYEGDA